MDVLHMSLIYIRLLDRHEQNPLENADMHPSVATLHVPQYTPQLEVTSHQINYPPNGGDDNH